MRLDRISSRLRLGLDILKARFPLGDFFAPTSKKRMCLGGDVVSVFRQPINLLFSVRANKLNSPSGKPALYRDIIDIDHYHGVLTLLSIKIGNRQRRKTKSLLRVVYKSAHTLLDFNCLLKYQSFI